MSEQVIRASVIGSNGVEVSCIGPEPPEGSPVTVGKIPTDLDNLLAMLRKTRDTRFGVVGPVSSAIGGYPDRIDAVTAT